MIGPATAERFRADLHRLTGAPAGRLGVAVSGGADSLALLLLAAAAFPGQVEAATVDHGFRAAAGAEAEAVARVCLRLGVPHAILVADPADAAGSLQMRARTLRYDLLDQWRRDRALRWLLTAHHLDDQAETVLMRAARGSGVGGLGGVRPVLGPAAIARPLLGWRKAELAAIVVAARVPPVDDPANRDPRHDRTHARRLLGDTGWLDPARLAAVADHARDASHALDWATDRLWGERVAESDGGWTIDVAGVPRELRRRLLVRAVSVPSEHKPAPRPDRVARLLDRLDAGRSGTIGSIAAQPGPPWRITIAPPRRTTIGPGAQGAR